MPDAVAAALPPGDAAPRPVFDGEVASRDPRPVAQAPEPRGDGAPYERTTAAERRHGAGAATTAGAHLVDEGLSLPEQVARLERAAIAAALKACRGNRAQAARRLGIARATLYQKLAAWPDLADAAQSGEVAAGR